MMGEPGRATCTRAPSKKNNGLGCTRWHSTTLGATRRTREPLVVERLTSLCFFLFVFCKVRALKGRPHSRNGAICQAAGVADLRLGRNDPRLPFSFGLTLQGRSLESLFLRCHCIFIITRDRAYAITLVPKVPFLQHGRIGCNILPWKTPPQHKSSTHVPRGHVRGLC